MDWFTNSVRGRLVLTSGVIVLLLSLRSVGAAELAGKVTNEQGTPLPYAPVQVRPDESSSPAFGVNADSTGVFVIRNLSPGRYLISADYVGHDPWREMIDLREPLRRVEIVLRTRPIRGQDIVVTAVRRLEATTAASVSVSLVTDDALEYRGVRSLDQALETLDGLQVFRSHSVATNSVSIRGSSDVLGGGVGNRVLLLVDGRPALNTDSGGQSWSLVPIGAVERVEVVKGAFSALYGSSAMGGVINLITRDPLGAPETRFVARYGAFEKPPAWMQYRSGLADFSETSVLHSDHRGSTGYVVYAAHNRSDGHRESSDYSVWQAYGKVAHTVFPGVEIGGSMGGGRSHAGYPHRWKSLLEPLKVPDEKKQDRQNKGWWNLDVTTKAGTLEHGLWNAGLYTYGMESATKQPLARLSSSVTSQRMGSRVQWQKQMAGFITQTFGGEGSLDFVRSDSVLYGNRSARNAALFSLSEVLLSTGQRLDFGIRGDYTSLPGKTTETLVNPKLGLTIPVGRTFFVRASVGRAFRSPSIAERYLVLEPAGGTEFAPNDSLRPEKMKSYELGLTHDLSPVLKMDVAAFVNDYDDWIYWRELPVQTDGRYRFQVANLLKVRMSGVDAQATLEPFQGFSLALNYLYLRAEDRTTGRSNPTIPYRPRHTFSGVVVFTHGKLRNTVVVRGRSRVEEEVFAAYQVDAPHGFVLTHLRTDYSLRRWLTFSFETNNLFNVQYEEMARFRMPGRSFSVGLTMKR